MKSWTVADVPSHTGKLAVVTGANSGIGWHTALELARAGGEIILTARTESKGRDAVTRILREVPSAKVRFELLDLARLKSVHAFAAKVGKEAKIDLLINNAGVMSIPKREMTEDGFEMQMGTNFFGHFALTGLLMPALLRSKYPRVTTVSSVAAKMGLKRIRFEDLHWEKGYSPLKAYCQSKLADLLLMEELGRMSAGTGLVSNAAHPGGSRTNLLTSGPGKPMNIVQSVFMGLIAQDAASGALPTLRAATSSDAGTGSFFGPDGMFEIRGAPVSVAVPKAALDKAAARKLWELAERLTSVSWPVSELRRAG